MVMGRMGLRGRMENWEGSQRSLRTATTANIQ